MTTQPRASALPDGGRTIPRERWTKAGPVVSGMPAERVAELQERSEVSVGEPGGFSLFGFAVGTLIMAIPLSGFVPLQTGVLAALAPVLVFAGLAQFIGGLIALRKGNTFAGTAFCAYGANNTLIATYYLFQAAGLFPAAAGPKLLLGVELFCFAYISLVLAIAALPVNLEFVGILLAWSRLRTGRSAQCGRARGSRQHRGLLPDPVCRAGLLRRVRSGHQQCLPAPDPAPAVPGLDEKKTWRNRHA